MSDDHTTEVAVRPSSATVRLFHGLGGVELGVRHTGRKALVFVKFRKLVIAGWWKAPSVLESTVLGTPSEPGTAPAAPVPARAHAPLPASGPAADARRPPGPPKLLSVTAASKVPLASAAPGAQAATMDAEQNVMHRLWRRVSAALKPDR